MAYRYLVKAPNMPRGTPYACRHSQTVRSLSKRYCKAINECLGKYTAGETDK